MSKVKNAVEKFEKGYSCSQAILAAYCPDLGLSEQQGLGIASGFGGGMGMAQTCGAVTGALMVLGLKYGPAKEKAYPYVMEFTEMFKQRNGSVVCKELLGCDINTRDGLKTAKEKGLFTSVCTKLVQDAAQILEGMIY